MKKKQIAAFLSAVLSAALLSAVPAAAGVTGGGVCRIDATGYPTLGAALTAVTEGKTIVLLTDIACDSPIIANTCSFSVDLAGFGLSVASAQVYCLAATGGKQLSIVNSSETPVSLTITQTIADDFATASNFGAVYTNGKSSRIVIAANIYTSVTSNMIGVDASDGNSIQIGGGTIRADRLGINVTGKGSVLFTGDVYGLGSGADGVSCRYSGDVQVNGAVYSDGIGVDAQSYGHVSVTNGVTAYDAHGSDGVYATEGAVVQITGEVTAPTLGVFAAGGTIHVDGSVTGTGTDSIGAFSRDTNLSAMQGTVTITGSVSGKRYGAQAAEGGTVLVGGNASSTAGTAAHTSAAIYSKGVGSMIIVSGNVTAGGQNSSGVEVFAGGTAEVSGNVTAPGESSYGVRALSGTYYEVMYGSTATVDGIITATKYILIGAVEKASNSWDEVTINGYLSFSGAVPLCYVYVKAPPLQAETPSASPAGGAVAAGTAVTLATATPGAEIRYTLDGSAPDAGSTLYTAPVPILTPAVLKAAAFKSGMTASGMMTEAYTILSAETPSASPAGGAVAAGTAVTLATATPGAEIRYTLDGSAPDAGSTLYTGPISVPSAMTIRAAAMLSGRPDSDIMTVTFTISDPPSSGYSSVAVIGSCAQASGAGSYSAGTAVSIHAGTRSGCTFAGWTSSDVTISNAGLADAVFSMPDHAVTVTAAWESVKQDVVYSILKGANGSWNGTADKGLSFLCDGPFASFSGILADGAGLPSNCYTAEPGSTSVVLKPDYLRTLEKGGHTLRLIYADGYAQTSFTVGSAESSIPKTGDASELLFWIFPAWFSGGTAAVLGFTAKRRKS